MSAQEASPSTVSVSRTVASDAPPGTWRHPRFDEIHQRLSKSTFGERNVRSIVSNLILLLFAFVLPSLSKQLFGANISLKPFRFVLWLALGLCRIIAVYNIATACFPLLRHKDDLADIPLTPRQRALLGLRQISAPATPGSTYVTPPKYTPSSTPRTSSTDQSSPYSGSSRGTGGVGTPYSPSASPLFQKAVNRDITRRISYGTPSPLSLSKNVTSSNSSLASTHTPSPTTGRGASVALNSRWLYEKGRSSSHLKSL